MGWLLWACSSPTVRSDSGTIEVSNGPQTGTDAESSLPPEDPTLEDTTSSIPYPDAQDSLDRITDGTDLSLSGDSALLAYENAEKAASKTQGDSIQDWGSPSLPNQTSRKPSISPSRPDGILSKAKPRELPDHVRVLVMSSTRSLAFYSLGEIQLLAENPSSEKGSPSINLLTTLKGRFDIKRNGSGFDISRGNKLLGSSSSKRLRLASVNPYNLIDLGGTVYRGGMLVVADANSMGTLSGINVLGVEDYLRGVLPYEMGTVGRDALEALKAQAIVARTYVYKRMIQANHRDFHVYSDVQDQVYRGVKGEYLLSDRAIWETRGIAVQYNDSLAQCYYYSTCSGRTSSKHEVWNGEPIPYLISLPDTDLVGEPFCQASKYSNWKEDWSLPQLSAILKRNLKSAGVSDAPSFSKIINLEITSRASCGRIRILKITTDRGPIFVRGDKVRWALRPKANEEKILPSAWFDIELEDGMVRAQGRGFGHGIGLCQVGALARARADQNFKQIIQAYYSGVELVEYK